MISLAHAAEAGTASVAGAPTTSDTFMFNIGMIAVLFVLFYIILIRPQQKRIKEQQTMLDGLKKGDRVVTAGGLIGKISKLTNDREVEVDLGAVKVTALRYTLQIDAGDTTGLAKPEKSDKKADKADGKDDKAA